MKRRRSGEPRSLGVVLATSFQQAPDGDRVPVPIHVWEEAVGTKIASRTRPWKLDRGTLVVKTSGSTWAQELSLLAPEILTQLARLGYPVKELRFQAGRVDPLSRPPNRSVLKHVARPAKLELDLLQRLATIEDPELREVLCEAAQMNLGWQSQFGEAPAADGAPPLPKRGPKP